jgi:hypothetical protein
VKLIWEIELPVEGELKALNGMALWQIPRELGVDIQYHDLI